MSSLFCLSSRGRAAEACLFLFRSRSFHFFSISRENKKPCLRFRKQGERNSCLLQNLLTPALSKLPSGLCPNGALISAWINAHPEGAQPERYRSCRVAFATRIVGQLVADMFMQVLIERVRRVAQQLGYSPLILLGVALFFIRIFGWIDSHSGWRTTRNTRNQKT